MSRTRLAPLGWKKGPFLVVRPAGKKRKPKKKKPTAARRSTRKWKKTPYSKYLASEHWQNLRSTYLPKASCAGCNSRADLELHHIHYSRVGAERTGDLTVLCRPCHEKLHKFLDERYPGSKTWQKARKTKEHFHLVFGAEWRPQFEVRLPGRSQGRPLGLTEAQAKART
jgi:5-methylcytosine-specific restriction endonuclease McrA